MARKSGVSTPRRLTAALNAQKALELRLAHKRWSDVAREVGYANASVAYSAVMRLMSTMPAENVEEFRALELARLEELREKLRPFAERDGDVLGRWLGIADRIYRLRGIAANVKVQAQVSVTLEEIISRSWPSPSNGNGNSRLENAAHDAVRHGVPDAGGEAR